MPDLVTVVSGLDTVPIQRLIMRNINGKGLGTALIGTIPAGKIFLPTQFVIGIVAPQTISTPPTVSIGTNATNYDDLVAAVSLTGAANLTAFNLVVRSPYPILVGGTNVNGKISVAGVSSGAITMTLVALGIWV